MPKLIFVIDSLISGGAERVMSVLANRFSEIGYDTTIISKAHIPSFYKLEANVKLVYLKTRIDYRNVVSTMFSRLKLYLNIYKYLKTEKPDFVISFSTTTNGITIIVCKLLGLYVIASEHTNYKINLNSFSGWFIKRIIYPHASLLTVLTERDKNEYYGRFMKNVIVMPNPLPLDPVEDVNLKFREKIILSIGDIPHKRKEDPGRVITYRGFKRPLFRQKSPSLKAVPAGDPAVPLAKSQFMDDKISKPGLSISCHSIDKPFRCLV